MNHRAEEELVLLIRVAGLLILLLTAGCAGMDRASQGEPPKTGAMQEKAPGLEPQQAAAKQETAVAAKPAQTAPKQSGPVAVEPAPTPAAPPAAASPIQSAAKPEAAAAKLPAQAPASPAPKEPAPKKESAAPPAPPLDLASLETRLKETNAIGVFTKLTLKNQVDALLDRFREYYQGRIKTTLAQLRQPYDQLLLKVLSLLQDSDPPLARAIAQSREAIWGILSDPDKFKNL
jgi:hypothetical protein